MLLGVFGDVLLRPPAAVMNALEEGCRAVPPFYYELVRRWERGIVARAGRRGAPSMAIRRVAIWGAWGYGRRSVGDGEND